MIASLLWALHSASDARRWKRAAHNVAATQREVLLRIVRANAGSELGREHGFDSIDSVAAYQKRVPLRSYDDFRPFIDRIAAGATDVLTTEKVIRFGVTSGSTSGSKLIPYTRSLLEELQHGIGAWVWRLFREHPTAFLGKSYWSVTPAGQRAARSSGGIPIGFDDERPFFDLFTRRLLAAMMAAPPELAHLSDMDTFRYATLRFLLQERALSWISIWNPTFLTLLMEPLWEWRQSLLTDVRDGTLSRPLEVTLGDESRVADAIRASLRADPGRAAELAHIFAQRTPALYERIWPNLRLISCWADGAAADTIPLLKSYFPSAVIQPKGLLATEAFVSFPYRQHASALSLLSHFFEFESAHDGIRLAHELTQGARYRVIVTTSGGLYRYRMHDLVEVVGHVDDCPLIRFVGRADAVVDLRGEKLHETFAAEAVRRTLARHGIETSFVMLTPNQNGDGYVLFIQGDVVPDLANDLDDALRSSFQYDYCRRLGQLQACCIVRIDCSIDAAVRYVRKCTELGQRLGDIKPAILHPFRGWASVLGE